MRRGAPSQDHAFRSYRILKIVLLYAVFSSLWILLSDKAMEWLFHNPDQLTLASVFKGWFFVAVTSLMLYGLMRSLLEASAAEEEPLPLIGLRPLAPFALIAFAVVIMTAGGAMLSIESGNREEESRLRAIVDFKTSQVGGWLREREGDARFVQDSSLFSDMYRRWRNNGDESAGEALKKLLDEFRVSRFFQRALLVNERGDVQWDSEPSGCNQYFPPQSSLPVNANENGVVVIGPYRGSRGELCLDFVGSLKFSDFYPAASVVLRVDPSIRLFPMLQSWLVTNTGGESLLFRRDGNDVLFLNGLRGEGGTEEYVRIPLAEKTLTEAIALRGERRPEDVIEGENYLRKPVVSVVRAVPGSNWLLSVEVNRSELRADAARDAIWIALSGSLALFIVTVGFFLLRKSHELGFSLREREIQAEKLRALRLLDAIAEGSGDAIFAKDVDGCYLFFNREAGRLVGKAPEEVLGCGDFDIFPPEEADAIVANDREVMRLDKMITFQEDLATALGRIALLTTKAPLRDGAGIVTGVFGISRDITERKRVEEALRASEERHRRIIETAEEGICMTDADWRITFVNARLEELLGVSLGEALGRRVTDFMDSESATTAESRIANQQQYERERRDYRFIRKDGSELWAIVATTAILGETGEFSGALAMVTDITEHKLAEQALRESEEKYRLLVENAREVIYVVQGGVIVYANKMAETLTGLSPSELLGKSIYDFACPEDIDGFREHHDRILKGETPLGQEECRIMAPGGDALWLSFNAVPIQWHGSPASLNFATDITQRKRAEEDRERLEEQLRQAQKIEAVGTLAGGIAHDFNNILTPIIGYTELAIDAAPLSSPMRSDLEQVVKAARRARDLVRQILVFSRHAEGDKKAPLNVGEIVGEALQLLRATIPATVEIRQEIGKGVALVDATQIHQVVVNLCTNACHAMDDRGVIDVRLAGVELNEADIASLSVAPLRPGRHLKLSVADTGHGMTPETMQRIFDPYFTTKGVGKGSGLGLAVVHGIVKRHGGVVAVRSELGKGSNFDVYIPCVEWNEPPLDEPIRALPRGSERVLIVDDEPALAKWCGRVLTGLGYEVVVKTDGLEALDAFSAAPDDFDLIMTDYSMPHITGTDLAAAALRIRPGVPIILCTGYSERGTEIAALELGVKGYALKPLDRARLAGLVRRVLDEEDG